MIQTKNTIVRIEFIAPSTAEKFTIGRGPALPHMEGELEKMAAAILHCKNGEKYETSVFTVSAGVR